MVSVLAHNGIKIPPRKFNITASEPANCTFNLGSAQSGIFIFGGGGGDELYPGVYSITRNGTVQTILAAYSVTSISGNGTIITVNRSDQGRATALWIKIQD